MIVVAGFFVLVAFALIVAGVALLAGCGWALIAAGVACALLGIIVVRGAMHG